MATALIIDDSDAHRAKLRQELAESGLFDRLVEAGDGMEGLKQFLAHEVDIVLCAIEMPDLDAERLCGVKAATPTSSRIPFVFLTGSVDPVRRARLLEAGGSDALARPCHARELVARVRLQLEGKWLRDDLIEKHEALGQLSSTDALTGLRNRHFLSEALSVEFMRARRFLMPFTLLMLDIDHFKQVNDRFGHQAGDAVLRGVGRLVRRQTRATDVAGRYGGEELAVILTHTPLEGGLIHGENLRGAIERASFQSPTGDLLHVTMSIGVASYHAGMKAAEDLIAAADLALYRAKRNGRNRVDVQL